jgi:hypothetical protein
MAAEKVSRSEVDGLLRYESICAQDQSDSSRMQRITAFMPLAVWSYTNRCGGKNESCRLHLRDPSPDTLVIRGGRAVRARYRQVSAYGVSICLHLSNEGGHMD